MSELWLWLTDEQVMFLLLVVTSPGLVVLACLIFRRNP